ncbi:MAG: helix-turn-helix transcriptional regulator [Ktedonobacteraceae bacterium]|nr:helix-turn-helix transcriptional regulator [Ktedonobacteraceae bacterium]
MNTRENTPELRALKMAWLAAREAGDTQAQSKLLRDHPEEIDELINFIAAYHATGSDAPVREDEPLLPLTMRACQSALQRVFTQAQPQVQSVMATTATNLAELRRSRGLNKQAAATGLRLGVDVWNKFEAGAIELASLSQRQLQRLAQFFQVSADQFATLLGNSQAAVSMNRRQTLQAAQQRQGPQTQSFADAIARSQMTEEDRRFWLEE